MFDASNFYLLEIDSERESKYRDYDSSDHRKGADQFQINMKMNVISLRNLCVL